MNHKSTGCFSYLIGGCLAMLAGCGPSTDDPMSPPTRTGLAIAVSLAAQSDVARIRFTLERITCINEPFTPSTVSTDKPLEDILLPGGIPGFENTPLDDSSEHLFADMFLTAAPGCYRVTSQPLTTQGSFSLDCAAATAPRVQIHEGLTTEQILINQCNGADSGGVDVVSTLNSPPTLVKLEFTKSKFIMQCQTQEVCATVSDPENDPVSFVWTTVSGPPLLTDLWVTSSKTEADGSSTQCVALVPDSPGQYGLSMTAYDLLHDPATGELVRIEDYLAQQGNPHPSHKSIIFPFYAAEDGVPGNCTPKSCQELKQRAPSMPSGNYTVDPDGPGSTEPFEVYCDMEKDGGGWTLALVSSDDEQNTWTWDQRTLMTTDQTLVGDLSALNRDFKSRALHALPFQSLLFVHAPSGIWASYSGVSNGTMDVASFMNSINAPVCDLSLAGHGYPQTAGTMALSGKLCDTNLYFHLGDFDGTGSASYCSGTTTQDSTYGPAWNMNNNQGCPFDDPGGASLGPDIGSRPDEVTGIGFGSPLGLNTGTPGTATNYIQMYIR